MKPSKYIRHKNMRDVYAQVLEEKRSNGRHHFTVLWINRLGTYAYPGPCPIGAEGRLAIEEISIDEAVFRNEWEVRDDA